MDIPDLSEKRLEVFIGKGWVKTLGDLYELWRYRDEFIATPGFGEKLFDRIIKTIEARRSCTLNQFIAGLGIHTVGRSAGRTLYEYFGGDWDAFEQAILDGFDFTVLKDFGQTMHDNIYAWYADPEAEKLWRPLLKHITFIKKEKENDTMNTANPFNRKTVVATGKLENYTRDGIQTKLLSLGAKPAGSVSKHTDYLIVGEGAGSKLDKARQLGVTTLTEAEFETMLAGVVL
jgi:DNA ligase (NAD+)